MKRLFIILSIIYTVLFFVICIAEAANNSIQVIYTGVTATGTAGSLERDHPLYKLINKKLDKFTEELLKRNKQENELPFDLIIGGDKRFDYVNLKNEQFDLENNRKYYGLTMLVSRDDLSIHNYQNLQMSKTYVNSGLSLLIYNIESIGKKSIYRVIKTIPLSSYMIVEKDFLITKQKAPKIFQAEYLSSIKQVMLEEMLKRLKRSIEQEKNFMLKRETRITYQIVDCIFESRKAKDLFAGNKYEEQKVKNFIAQWLSDFLISQKGLVVLPPLKGEVLKNSSKNMNYYITRDGNDYKLEMAPAKYPIKIILTGLTKKIIETTPIDANVAYKVWLRVEIPNKNYSKEFSLGKIEKMLVNHLDDTDLDKGQFLDLIYQLSYDIAKEASF